jgi:hypothetical protein
MAQPIQVFEIFAKIELETSRPKRLKLMQQYSDVPAFKDILRGMFDDTLEFLLPEGKPPYTPNIPESVPSTLLKKHRQFGYFVRGGPGTSLPAYKRERMFIELLESVHPDDALLVLAMVGKKPPFKGLTKKLVKEAFPNLIQT